MNMPFDKNAERIWIVDQGKFSPFPMVSNNGKIWKNDSATIGEYIRADIVEKQIRELEKERDRYKFNYEEMKRSYDRQTQRYHQIMSGVEEESTMVQIPDRLRENLTTVAKSLSSRPQELRGPFTIKSAPKQK